MSRWAIWSTPRRRGGGAGLFVFALALLLWVALACLGAVLPEKWAQDNLAIFRVGILAGSFLALLLILVGLGLNSKCDPFGVMLTNRNRYSLSRLQMTAWTYLVLGALAATVICRSSGLGTEGLSTALSIAIDPNLMQAMGISLLSGAAAPAILGLKTRSVALQSESDAAARKLGEPLLLRGRLVSRPSAARPKFADLVEGDDVGDAGSIDLSKVQQLIVSALLIATYACMLFGFFGSEGFDLKGATKLPSLSSSFVELLLISHAGYLGYKAAPKAGAVSDSPLGAEGPPPTPDRKLAPSS